MNKAARRTAQAKLDKVERGTTDWDRTTASEVTGQINAKLRHNHVRGAKARQEPKRS